MGARVAYLVAGIAVAACLGGACTAAAAAGPSTTDQRAPGASRPRHACLASGAVQRLGLCRSRWTPIDGPGRLRARARRSASQACAGGRVARHADRDHRLPADRRARPLGAQTRVQPAAYRYFGRHVVGIRQIASYGCRGRNGNGCGNISEHAFGNALDIAGFRLGERRGDHRGQGLVARHATRARLPAGESSPAPAPSSTPCSARAATATTTTTSTSICSLSNASHGRHYCRPIPGRGAPMARGRATEESTASVRPIPFVGPGDRLSEKTCTLWQDRQLPSRARREYDWLSWGRRTRRARTRRHGSHEPLG